MRAIFTIILMLLCTISSAFANGLFLKGADIVTDPRCRYDVFKYKNITLKESITIDFDVKLDQVQTLGDVLNIQLTEDSEPIRLVYATISDNLSKLLLVNSNCTLMSMPVPAMAKWFPLSLTINLSKGSISMSIDQHSDVAEIDVENIPLAVNPTVVFGCEKLRGEAISFSIRNLKVGDSKQIFTFPLDEHSGNDVYDIKGYKCGYVHNPNWLVVNKYQWEEIFHYTFDDTATANYINDDFIITTKDTLFKFNIGSRKIDKLLYANPAPMYSDIGTSFCDQRNGDIYLYEALKNHPTTVARLDLDSLKWSSVSSHSLRHQRHHHSSHLDTSSLQYTIFGGFGSMKYSNEFNSFSPESNEWESLKLSGDTIEPRFFSSAIKTSDTTMLIFAGKGNISGDQTLGAEYYCDLYDVNLQSQVIKELWSLDPASLGGLLIPIRQGVLSGDGESFYTIMYDVMEINPEMQLYKFSIATGQYSTIANKLPMLSGNIKSTANIFEDNDGEYIYCYKHIYDMANLKESTITLYRLACEPISLEDAASMMSRERGASKKIIFAALLLVIIASAVMLRYRIGLGCKPKPGKVCGEPTLKEDNDESKEILRDTSSTIFTSSAEIKSNSIYIHGPFTVYDRNGVDISHLFSPKIKQLFLLILFKSSDGSEGISSINIQSTLWFDYPVAKSKNLRGVTMYNLRNAIRLLDGVDIVYENGRFRVLFEEECYCDYNEMLQLAKQENLSDDMFNKFVTIASRGILLQQYDDEIFDSYKLKSEESVMNTLFKRVAELFEGHEYGSSIYICGIIRRYELLNEIALWYEVQSLSRIKKKSEAKNTFVKFTKTFYKNMGEEYKYNFSQFLSTEISEIN
ncbi:MAG: hypothetical protein SNI51_09470 [Rikenellaceae bacterium]